MFAYQNLIWEHVYFNERGKNISYKLILPFLGSKAVVVCHLIVLKAFRLRFSCHVC